MNWTIPGTTIEAKRADATNIESLFQPMFLAGGLTLSQVSSITGLEPYAIQNWVKRGFLSAPKGKRYNQEQVCRIITINMLKGALPLEKICSLMQYINGDLADDSDDIIDDAVLYFMFVKLAARIQQLNDPQEREQMRQQVMSEYQEPIPGAKQRVEKVLQIMLTAWVAERLRQEAERMLDTL